MSVELHVLTFSGQCHVLSPDVHHTIREVKHNIYEITQVSHLQQQLLLDSRVLKDDEVLEQILPTGKPHHELFLVICQDTIKLNLISGMNYENLMGVDPEYREDPDVMMAAAKHSAFFITFASASLKQDVNFVSQALHFNCFVADYLPKEMVAKAFALKRDDILGSRTCPVSVFRPVPQPAGVADMQMGDANEQSIPLASAGAGAMNSGASDMQTGSTTVKGRSVWQRITRFCTKPARMNRTKTSSMAKAKA